MIDVIIDVVANHRGFFSFRLCPHDAPDVAPSPACFARHPLSFEDGSDKHYLNVDDWTAPRKGKRVELRLRLPKAVTCWHCVLQWTYVTGNNWGSGPQTAEIYTEDCVNSSEGKLGCGNQETFRGCADICIGKGWAGKNYVVTPDDF